ncbi:hypothetical protein V1639_11505 [Pseudarthrobacter sp. J75]|uniref:hypothetical protein n=1 Tax=unclassified Pseudarthrobacter TaxID=2647000 RepID=UPI002E82299F|nr:MULTISPECIES: hypothetical protein [unclassified Pseudarthrobacter]MEE2522784.1 hypothetical protein [Pseudarthrobacter sp. J47]MEE2529645.1 hypothetical protein [Pseudarthrobacter sp. J75]
MNRPEPGSPDQGANQDDAVWLDLVSRLQEEPQTPPHEQGPSAETHEAGKNPAPAAPVQPATPRFADFDPLGLSNPAHGPAHREPSAAERAGSGQGAAPLPGPRDYEVDDDDEGGFVPEEPPSLAGTEPLTMLAWLGAVGGPVTLLMFAMFWRAAPLLAILGVIAAFVAAVGYLIMRLPHEKNDSDDGARV